MKIHILAISGAMTAPLAVALKKQGHQVTGSDQEKIYPPFSTILTQADIPINKELSSVDLCIVGSGYRNQQKLINEFEEIKKNKIPYISATEYIARHLIKNSSILVAGSYGKSSTTSMLAWIFSKTKYNPSYMFGGQPKNRFPALRFTDSDWSICEADESINGLDTKAKFLYYPVKYLVLTSANWEHKESYHSAQDNFNAFKELVENIPKDGVLFYNQTDPSLKNLLPFAKCTTLGYNQTRISHPTLFGPAFVNNFSAVNTVCNYFKIDSKSITSYRGLKLRLELVSQKKQVLFYSDFAQSAPRMLSTINALVERYPKRPIKVILEPHASFLQFQESIQELSKSLQQTTHIYLARISFTQAKTKDKRISFNDYKQVFGDKISYLPINTDLIKSVVANLKPNDIVVRFSSGGLIGHQAYRKIINLYGKT